MTPLRPIQLYNTLARAKQTFEPSTPGRVGMYVCGPTVYSDAHLGHAKAQVSFDVIRRYLEHIGYTVRFVSNITDVGHLVDDADEGDDKIAKRAVLEKLEGDPSPAAIYVGSTAVDTCLPGLRAGNDLSVGDRQSYRAYSRADCAY